MFIFFAFMVWISLSCALSQPSRGIDTSPAPFTFTPQSPGRAVSSTGTEASSKESIITASPTQSLSPTIFLIPTFTQTLKPSSTQTHTEIPAVTLTPTISPSLTISFTPTYALPRYSASMQANCRYGPGTAYLYAWGLYPGDTGTVWGRNATGTWLWVQPDAIHYQCWVAASVVEVEGDIMILRVAPVRLPHSDFYGPPPWVKVERNGDQVTISWGRVNMTEDDDQGYLIEANVCQKRNLVWIAVSIHDTSYTVKDELNCKKKSNGILYTVDKHGYSDPLQIPWPK